MKLSDIKMGGRYQRRTTGTIGTPVTLQPDNTGSIIVRSEQNSFYHWLPEWMVEYVEPPERHTVEWRKPRPGERYFYGGAREPIRSVQYRYENCYWVIVE